MKNHFPTYCLPAVIAIFVFAATISASRKAAANWLPPSDRLSCDSSLFTLHSSLKDTLHSSLKKDTVEVLFTGDILLDRGVRKRIEHIGIERLFSKGIDSLFRQADYVVGNLECPATKTVQPNFKKYVFRAEPEWLSVLREHHITHLNLANNHSIDQGRAGLVDTWRNVTAAGIIPFGAGNTMSEAAEPLVIRAAGEPGLSPQVSLPSCLSPQNGDLRNIYVVPTLRLALENFSYLTG